jgi:hypothetical protein
MVDPREDCPQLIGVHQAQNLPHAVGTRLPRPDQPFHSPGLAQLTLHGIQTALSQDEKKKNTSPDRPQGNAGPPARVFQLGDSPAEIKDLVDIPAEAIHHGRFPRACCFSWKNRREQASETFSINPQISW